MTESGPPEFEIEIVDRLKIWPERRDRWLYLSVPDRYTVEFDALLKAHPRGFRSVHVTARIADDEWESGVFRYQDGTWSLPVKSSVRRRHQLELGDTAKVHVRIAPPD